MAAVTAVISLSYFSLHPVPHTAIEIKIKNPFVGACRAGWPPSLAKATLIDETCLVYSHSQLMKIRETVKHSFRQDGEVVVVKVTFPCWGQETSTAETNESQESRLAPAHGHLDQEWSPPKLTGVLERVDRRQCVSAAIGLG